MAYEEGDYTNTDSHPLRETVGDTAYKYVSLTVVDDIKTNGIQESIKYVEHDGTKHVVDGHHRLIASKKIKIVEVPTEQVNLPYKGYKNIQDLLWFD